MTVSSVRASRLESGLLCIFNVPGQPVPKARARVVRGHTFTPERTKTGEARVAERFKVNYPHMRPFADPVSVRLNFYLKGNPIGDWDNFAKLVCDALNGKAWLDDRQVIHADVAVYREALDPRTEIEIWTW